MTSDAHIGDEAFIVEPSRISEVGTVGPSRIPVRNLWHMFLYASDLLSMLGKFEAAVEDGPALVGLLARILCESVERRLRRGMPRGYVATAGELNAIRGKIDVLRSVRAVSFERARVYCRFETLAIDTPRNRIIKSTLVDLLSGGKFGPGDDPSGTLRMRLKTLVTWMREVAVVRVTRDSFRREQIGRNDTNDRMILALCDMVRYLLLPTETEGSVELREIDREYKLVGRVYERFVTRFYELQLRPLGWQIWPQKHLDWPVIGASSGMHEHLPGMQADLVLTDPKRQRRVIIDTKFTNVLTRGRQEREVFKSGNLYQIYAYLRTQEASSPAISEGLLLYPAVNWTCGESMMLDGHILRLATVDLARPWAEIENALTAMVLASHAAC